MNIRMTLNAAASALFAGFNQARVACLTDKVQTLTLTPRKSTKGKESLYGYGVNLRTEDGLVVIESTVAAYLAAKGMKLPAAGTYFLKDITNGRFSIAAAVPAQKEGKRQLVNSETTVTVEFIEPFVLTLPEVTEDMIDASVERGRLIAEADDLIDPVDFAAAWEPTDIEESMDAPIED